jgi:hypothetical protein
VPIFVKDDISVLFIHIPKTGGTSLGEGLLKSGWKRTFYQSPGTEPDHYHLIRVSQQHYHARLLRAALRVPKFDLRFCMVRDPLARFRSEYAMRRQDPADGAEHVVEEWAEERLRRYSTEPTFLDNHLRPQHEFLVENTVVYRYEDGLEAAVNDLRDGHGIDIKVELKRRQSSHSRPDRLASSDVQISRRLEGRLRELYARDFEQFGYSTTSTKKRSRFL